MNWTEIAVKVPQACVDTAAAIANMTVSYGIFIEDYSDLESGAREIAHIDLIDENLIGKDREHAVIHLYISECDNAAEALAFLTERLTAEKIPYTAENVTISDTNWNENWKQYFHAVEIGEKLAIVPSWEKYENANRVLLHIDPGAAFGTGTHATTSLCLSMLEQQIKTGDRVLDIGCGSGILGIAAVLLGAENATGVDIDAQSVKTAKENAKINGLSAKTDFMTGNLTERVKGKYRVICANIVADVIIRLFDSVQAYMEDDAIFIISGIIDTREQEVLDEAAAQGFTVSQSAYRDHWCAFCLRQIKT